MFLLLFEQINDDDDDDDEDSVFENLRLRRPPSWNKCWVISHSPMKIFA